MGDDERGVLRDPFSARAPLLPALLHVLPALLHVLPALPHVLPALPHLLPALPGAFAVRTAIRRAASATTSPFESRHSNLPSTIRQCPSLVAACCPPPTLGYAVSADIGQRGSHAPRRLEKNRHTLLASPGLDWRAPLADTPSPLMMPVFAEIDRMRNARLSSTPNATIPGTITRPGSPHHSLRIERPDATPRRTPLRTEVPRGSTGGSHTPRGLAPSRALNAPTSSPQRCRLYSSSVLSQKFGATGGSEAQPWQGATTTTSWAISVRAVGLGRATQRF